MHQPDHLASPSWAVPIALGALGTFALLLVFGAGQALPVPGLQMAACCCCAAGFLPYGVLPAWIAVRRDPRLTGGQGFAVAFIAVGLGTIVWAALVASAESAVDPATLRESLEQAREGMPADQRMSDEDLTQMVDAVQELLPFLPALYAVVTTVLAGFVGMITVGMVRRRRRAPRDPCEDTDPYEDQAG